MHNSSCQCVDCFARSLNPNRAPLSPAEPPFPVFERSLGIVPPSSAPVAFRTPAEAIAGGVPAEVFAGVDAPVDQEPISPGDRCPEYRVIIREGVPDLPAPLVGGTLMAGAVMATADGGLIHAVVVAVPHNGAYLLWWNRNERRWDFCEV